RLANHALAELCVAMHQCLYHKLAYDLVSRARGMSKVRSRKCWLGTIPAANRALSPHCLKRIEERTTLLLSNFSLRLHPLGHDPTRADPVPPYPFPVVCQRHDQARGLGFASP